MSTREDQMAMILRKLYWMKKDQDAKAGMTDLERFQCDVILKRAIRKAMDIKPIACEREMGTGWQYIINHYTYRDEDNAKVDEVIRRLEAQGFIRLHQRELYKLVEVLKTK